MYNVFKFYIHYCNSFTLQIDYIKNVTVDNNQTESWVING